MIETHKLLVKTKQKHTPKKKKTQMRATGERTYQVKTSIRKRILNGYSEKVKGEACWY